MRSSRASRQKRKEHFRAFECQQVYVCTKETPERNLVWEVKQHMGGDCASEQNYLVFFLLRKIRYHLAVNYLYPTEVVSVPLARPGNPALRLETDRTLFLGVPEGQALISRHVSLK